MYVSLVMELSYCYKRVCDFFCGVGCEALFCLNRGGRAAVMGNKKVYGYG